MTFSSNRIYKAEESGGSDAPVFVPFTIGSLDANGDVFEKPAPKHAEEFKKDILQGPAEENSENTGSAESDFNERIIAKAQAQADKILAEARAEAEKIRENAAEEGYRAGFEKGEEAAMEEVQDRYDQALRRFHNSAAKALDDITHEKNVVIDKYLNELKDIAIAVAEKVIHVSLASSGEVIKRMITNEVEKRKKTAWMKIYIDQQDYDMLVQCDGDVATDLARISDNIRFVVVDNEKAGHTIIETPEEITDISVDTQMTNLKEKLSTVQIGQAG